MLSKTDVYRVKKSLNTLFKQVLFDKFAKYSSLDISLQIQRKVLEATAAYAMEHMAGAYTFTDNLKLLKWAIAQAELDGLVLEFGVWEGATVNFIAKQVAARDSTQVVHGFDSFEGLPEFWVEITHVGRYDKGAFDLQGKLPTVAKNVQLHPGWFDQSLPKFLAENHEPVAFMHVDCDLYSSTQTIFDGLGDRLRPGTIIVFDEYFNYPTWEKHEFKAFQEFVARKNLQYDYIAYNRVGREVAVKIC